VTHNGAADTGSLHVDPTAEGRAVAIRIAETIADTPASNTLVLDVHDVSPFTDYFVICSGENERQLRAIQREVVQRLAEAGTRPDRVEGNPVGGWIVLDYGDVVVHVFSADLRDYYRLEELWQDAPTVLAIQ